MSFVAGAVCVGVVVAVLAVSGVFDDGSTAPQSSGSSTTAPPTTTPISTAGASGDVAQIYQRASKGVVFVEAVGGGGQSGGSGSGFVIDDQGHVVTNEHVVDAGSSYKVRFGENGAPIDAKLLGADASNDLAVLKIDPSKADQDVQPLQLGDSTSVEPGEPTIAIGSPFGLEGTVTSGIVSGLDRTIQAPSGFSISGAIQTDAAINPGNSGGPLLDGQGRVIGVNSQIASESGSSAGVGFAIPVDQVKRVIPFLEKGEAVPHAYLGVSSGETPQGGALIGQVVPNGPADKGGLREGDRVVQIGSQPVRDPDDLSAAVNDRKPGEKVDIVVERGGERRTLTVTLGTQPDQPTQQ